MNKKKHSILLPIPGNKYLKKWDSELRNDFKASDLIFTVLFKMNNLRAQERVQEAREKMNDSRAQARELGIHNYENMSAFDLQQAVHQARNRARPLPAPRPPPDQITRTRPVPRPRTIRPLLIPHLPLPTQTPAPILTQAPIPAPRPDRPRTAAQVYMQQRHLPILRPIPATKTSNVASLKQLAGRVVEPVKKQLNKFADWILSYVPEPVKRTVNDRLEKLKAKVNEIFGRIDKLKPK